MRNEELGFRNYRPPRSPKVNPLIELTRSPRPMRTESQRQQSGVTAVFSDRRPRQRTTAEINGRNTYISRISHLETGWVVEPRAPSPKSQAPAWVGGWISSPDGP